MRTTLKIADDVMEAARTIALAEGRSIGDVVSQLARKGLRPTYERLDDGGFPTFQVADDARALTPDMVARAQEED